MKTLIAAVLSVLLCAGLSAAQGQKAVHKDCSKCHQDAGKKPQALVKATIDDLCLGCHAARKGKDHPVGLVSKVAPKGLPLDKESRLTCITCHEPHGKQTVGSLLRMEFNSLCRSCHTDK